MIRIVVLPAFLFCFSLVSFSASKQPAWAAHAMISSADLSATEVGLQVLRNGGNAVDAAAATALALGVTEGFSSGLGGGCFMLIRLADGTVTAIDGRETAPAKSTRLMFVPKDSDSPKNLSTVGSLAAGTPGELAALNLAVSKYGTKPLSELLEGAIALADTGFRVGFRYASALQKYDTTISLFPATRAVYYKNEFSKYQFGDQLVQKDLAKTLRAIQTDGITAFYSGWIADSIADFCKRNGGVLSKKDLANYKPVERSPVSGEFRGYQIYSMPPPSSGGIHVIQILNLIEPYDLFSLGAGSSASLHLIAEAMQIAFADRAVFLGDPAFVKIPTEGMLSSDYLNSRRQLIQFDHHEKLGGAGDPWSFSNANVNDPDGKHTTHFCVVDSFGNAVALTATINTPFGSGVIVPGTGILLNNEMDDFVTNPGKPNYFGLVGNSANEIVPGKRPLSSMSPTIVAKDGKTVIVAGGAGGPRIISGVVMTLLNTMVYGMQLQQAVDYPRIHQQWVPDSVFVEPEIPADVRDNLTARGHTVIQQPYWAVVMAISADSVNGGWRGASDSRADGTAKGF